MAQQSGVLAARDPEFSSGTSDSSHPPITPVSENLGPSFGPQGQ